MLFQLPTGEEATGILTRGFNQCSCRRWSARQGYRVPGAGEQLRHILLTVTEPQTHQVHALCSIQLTKGWRVWHSPARRNLQPWSEYFAHIR